jgi:hypothetical protein
MLEWKRFPILNGLVWKLRLSSVCSRSLDWGLP